ncbi:MAG TPA: peptidylprolyl isomerase [Euryarchaeota archaeon]|nr:peptidylprolyl isomerase [Euryarchaeota archaeon]HIQ10121.1 peptidylprolyl isomerase [Euryarchaeota archaeon]
MARVLLIAYEGKEKESGKVFDRVEEEEPYPVILGEDSLIPGLAEALENMKEGEEQEIELPPEKAFGERKKELVVIIPEKEFRKRGVVPVPGLVIEADGRSGKILSVSGGRVQVDFNHELAGKTVVYRVKVLAELKKPEEVAEALFRRFMRSKLEKVSFKDGVLEVVYTPGNTSDKNVQKLLYVASVLKAVPEVKEVRITERYVRKDQGES